MIQQWKLLVESAQDSGLLLYHGTSVQKARSIVAHGFTPRGAKNTFGKSISFSDKPVGTRLYDKGAVLVYRLKPGAKLISLAQFQNEGRGDADAVADNASGAYDDREIAVFNPDAVEFVGWYNKQTRHADPVEPVYPKGFRFNWNSQALEEDENRPALDLRVEENPPYIRIRAYLDQEIIGYLTMKKTGSNVYSVAFSDVEEEFRRKGFGKSLYLEAIRQAADRGCKLQSDMGVSVKACILWQSLENNGFKVVMNPDTKLTADGYVSLNDKPVYWIAENASGPQLDPKAFLLTKWKERAAEMGRPEPNDLTGACKFAAMFAKAIYGGKIMANDWHTWVVLNGKVIDLAEDASDARDLKAGKMPPSMQSYAKAYGLSLPKTGVYTPDELFMHSDGFEDSLASIKPRVKRWVAEYKKQSVNEETIPAHNFASGREVEVELLWNPSAPAAKRMVDRAEQHQVRGLVVGDRIVIWTDRYVEHKDIERALGLPSTGRETKFFLVADPDYRVVRSERVPPAQLKRLERGGFKTTSK